MSTIKLHSVEDMLKKYPNSPTLVIKYGTEFIGKNRYKGKDYECIFISKSVKEIQGWAFCKCEHLKEVIFEEGSMLTQIG